METECTIAAVATPAGEGGIAVIRISGKRAVDICGKVVKAKKPLSQYKARRAIYASIFEGDKFIDDVIVTLYRSPASYTGEDVVEISCHGSTYIAQLIINLLIKNGAEPAQPGEFTKRAFLNGKMDLAQAEAVADLIKAKTESSRRVAAMQLKGGLSKKLSEMREQLIKVMSLIELELDFSEEDIEFASREKVLKLIERIKEELEYLLQNYRRGRICRDGINMVITGLPNVGKSSILNCLVQRERAIVTETPGTTRDTIEEILDVEGIQVKIIDTAGIRHSGDLIEKEGVKRAKEAVNIADLVIMVLDGSGETGEEETSLIKWLKDKKTEILCVINKTDLPMKKSEEDLNKIIPDLDKVYISAKTEKGIKELIRKITEHALKKGMPGGEEILITRERHKTALQNAVVHLEKAYDSIQKNMSQEFTAFDLRVAAQEIGSITGSITTDQILDNIFNEFCIGK